jgi:hypothetical protein
MLYGLYFSLFFEVEYAVKRMQKSGGQKITYNDESHKKGIKVISDEDTKEITPRCVPAGLSH